MHLWGVRLELDKPSPQGFYSEVGDLRVEAQKNSGQIVTCNVDATSEDEAYDKALLAANQFLNTLSWKAGIHLEVKRESTSVELRTNDRKSVIIKPGVLSLSLDLMIPEVVIKNTRGNIITRTNDSEKTPRIDVNTSEAAFYYRQGKLTNNSFDRFRNLYLVAENIADRIRNNRKLSEQELKETYKMGSFEKALLQFALDQGFENSLESLKQAAANRRTFNDKQPLIPQVAHVLYEQNRCALNHSKYSKDKKVPFKPKDEEEVGEAIPLMDFVAKSLLAYEETTLK